MSKALKEILGWLRVLTTPSCWLQNNTYSAEWDRLLNSLLRSNDFEHLAAHTAKIASITVWTSNHPYASFSPFQMGVPEVRPRRITILRAYDRLMHDGLLRMSPIMELERMYVQQAKVRR